MALRAGILISVLLVIVICCNVEAREGGFFQPPVKENAAYLDPKEYYPTGRENSYNNYYQSGNSNGNGYGNGAGEGGGYKETVNGYGRGAEYTTENGGGYGSGEWRGSNGGGGYGEGAQYGNYKTEFGNGERYGNGNGESFPNNGYNQENP